MAITRISRHLELRLNNRGDFLCVDLNDTGGRQVIDIRRWYTNDDDELMPTSKGVSIPVDHVAEVQKAIQNATGKQPAAKAAQAAVKKSTTAPKAAAVKSTRK